MAEYYFTLAQNHIRQHFPDSTATGGCVKVTALNSDDAREEMNNIYDRKWAFQYDDISQVHEADRQVLAEHVVSKDEPSDSNVNTSDAS